MSFEKASELLLRFNASAKRKSQMLPTLYRGLAAICLARGDYAGQQKWLEALLKVDPRNAAAWQALGQCLFQQKQAEAALEKYKQARSINPSATLPEVALAQLSQSSGDRENAKKWIQAALATAPKEAATHLAAARLAFASEQYDEMLREAMKALDIDQGNIDGMRLIGLVAYFRRDYKKAEAWFDSAYKRKKLVVLSNDLALSLVEQKDNAKKDRAFQIAAENAQMSPYNLDFAATLGWVYYKRDMLKDAEDQLRKAVRGGKNDSDTLYQFGRVLNDRGHTGEAKLYLEAAVNGVGPSVYRQDAKTLLASLKR